MSIQYRNTASSGTGVVLVQNTSDEVAPPYSVGAIGQTTSLSTGVLTRETPGVGRFLVPIRKPDSAAVNNGSVTLFLMTLDLPIQPGGYGYATTSFPTWVQLESGIYLRGDTVAPQADSWKLHKTDGGPFGIRDVQEGVGWITLLGGGSGGGTLFRFMLIGSLSSGQGGASFYDMGTGEEVAFGTIYDPEGIFSELDGGDRGLAIKQGGRYYVIQAQCPDEED